MTLKIYLWGMRISTVLAVLALGAIVYYIDPEESAVVGRILFYVSLFLAMAGILILFLTWIRRKFSDNQSSFIFIGMSFRQGILLSFLTVTLLFMQSFRILAWWDGLLMVAAIFLAELYFLSR